jgi:glycosyltransferase involved in cell wall biosynthesis
MTKLMNKKIPDKEPKVSIVCVTYRHEKFISQAIEGFLMQKTSFPFEIIIGEDYSPDKSRDIIKSYQDKYPERFVAIFRDKNIGPAANLVDLLSKVSGEYVAICDGDDYWTDEMKLQKQVDFLDKNLDFSMCCHFIKQIFEDKSEPEKQLSPFDYISKQSKDKGFMEFRDFFPINGVASLSVMYRWSLKNQIPKWIIKHDIADFPLHLLHANKGKVGIIKEVMGVYRKHTGGISFNYSKSIASKRKYMSLLKDINQEFDYNYAKIINPIINHILQKELGCYYKLRIYLGELMSHFWKTKFK